MLWFLMCWILSVFGIIYYIFASKKIKVKLISVSYVGINIGHQFFSGHTQELPWQKDNTQLTASK